MIEVRKAGTLPNSRAATAEYDLTGRTLEGHASVFDFEYQVSGERLMPFTEVVRKGAFRRSLATTRPVVQWAHGRDVIGQVPIAELLQASEDSTGLYFKARMFDAPQLDLLRQALESGQVGGASFRFQVNPGGERWSKADSYRELTSVSVLELGPVLWPASSAATVKLRRKDADIEPLRKAFNAKLRKAGLPEIGRDGRDVKRISRRDMQRLALPVLVGNPRKAG